MEPTSAAYALIELTMIGNPDVAEGQPQTCYLDPQLITAITVGRGAYAKEASPGEFHPRIVCTIVSYHGGSLLVLQPPTAVARLRDAALGLGTMATHREH